MLGAAGGFWRVAFVEGGIAKVGLGMVTSDYFSRLLSVYLCHNVITPLCWSRGFLLSDRYLHSSVQYFNHLALQHIQAT
jgi:hypothetical protein